LREFVVDNPEEYNLGQEITVDMFNVGDRVDVVGTTKGRGFAGVIKRYGFHRGPMTHGSRNVRRPGSIGCSAWPAKVIKGKKMPGQYGNDRKTIRNLEIVDIRPEDNVILVKGSVPGAESGLMAVNKPKFKRE
jgi:large subunit ribosomal protein L3